MGYGHLSDMDAGEEKYRYMCGRPELLAIPGDACALVGFPRRGNRYGDCYLL
jgi:hypothetical protein